MYDVIVVGSGASGTFAAHQLRGKRILVVDVGNKPPPGAAAFDGNLYSLRKAREGLHDELIGENYESLHNIGHEYLSPKLKAPYLRYIVNSEASSVESRGFSAVQSHARGGLANAWGGGVYEFTGRELAGFPISAAELAPYYEELSAHIGISGAEDTLAPYLPARKGLMPPLKLSRIGQELLGTAQQKQRVLNEAGFHLGRARLAVLSEDHRGRKACEYNNLEFFKPHIPSVYSPAYTLDELIRDGAIDYSPRTLALSYTSGKDGVSLTVKNLDSRLQHQLRGKKLVLAAGTLNTARLVLSSYADTTTRLPLLDNKISYVPMVRPRLLGSAVEKESFSTAQLLFVHDPSPSEAPLFGTFYGLTGPLRSDYLLKFPLTLRDNVAAAKYLSPAMGIVQLFYPDRPNPRNYVRLAENHALEITYAEQEGQPMERRLLRTLMRLGFYGHHSLCQFPSAGNSFHYAGSLPMRERPGRYETFATGKLSGTDHVFVADGATLPLLPSKNLTFTLMANAMRIADHVRRDLE